MARYNGSSDFRLQENDPGGGPDHRMRQLQHEREVIDYSHGHQGDLLMEQRQQQNRREIEYKRLQQQEEGQILMQQLRQRIMAGQADENTVQMLAKLGREMRARDEALLAESQGFRSRGPVPPTQVGMASFGNVQGSNAPPIESQYLQSEVHRLDAQRQQHLQSQAGGQTVGGARNIALNRAQVIAQLQAAGLSERDAQIAVMDAEKQGEQARMQQQAQLQKQQQAQLQVQLQQKQQQAQLQLQQQAQLNLQRHQQAQLQLQQQQQAQLQLQQQQQAQLQLQQQAHLQLQQQPQVLLQQQQQGLRQMQQGDHLQQVEAAQIQSMFEADERIYQNNPSASERSSDHGRGPSSSRGEGSSSFRNEPSSSFREQQSSSADQPSRERKRPYEPDQERSGAEGPSSKVGRVDSTEKGLPGLRFFVSGIDDKTSSTTIKYYFAQLGPLMEITRIQGKSFCYVQFFSVNKAQTDALESKMLTGKHILDRNWNGGSFTKVVCSKANPRKPKDELKDKQQSSTGDDRSRGDVRQKDQVKKDETVARKQTRPSQVMPGSLKDRAYKGLDVKIQQLREKSTPVEVINAVETNIDTLMTRLQDVEKTKQKPEYKLYLKKVPKTLREVKDPQTPDMFARCPMQVWQNRMTDWSQSLTLYKPDDPAPSTSKVSNTPPVAPKVPNTQPMAPKVQPDIPAEFKCDLCNITCKNTNNFQNHLQSAKHHKSQSTLCILCSLCNSWIPTSEYTQHLTSPAHAQKGTAQWGTAQRFKCQPCGCAMKAAPTKQNELHNIRQHLQSMRHMKLAKKTLIPCPACRRKFNDVRAYFNHLNSTSHLQRLEDIASKKINAQSEKQNNQVQQESHLKQNQYKWHRVSIAHTDRENSMSSVLLSCGTCRESFLDKTSFDAHNSSDYHKFVSSLKEGKFPLERCSVCNAVLRNLQSVFEHIQETEHINIMCLGGRIRCVLCPWEVQHTNRELSTREYWKHMEEKEHLIQMERLLKTFGSYQNIKCDEKETMQCGDCNKRFQGTAANHKCMDSNHKPNCCRYFIGGITKSIKEHHLKNYFLDFGPLVDVTIIPDQGIGYIQFIKHGSEAEDAKREQKLFQTQHKIKDKLINCTRANPKQTDPEELCTIEVTSESVYHKVMKAFFSQFGEICKDLICKPREAGSQTTLITYQCMESVDNVLDIYSCHDMAVQGFDLTIKQALPSKVTDDNIASTIFCINLDRCLTRIDLFNHFSKYGPIEDIELIKHSNEASGFCTIIYKEKKDMMKAYLRGIVADGSCTHTVLRRSVACKKLDKQSNEGVVLLKSVDPSITTANLTEYCATNFKYFKSVHMSRDLYKPTKARGYGLVKLVSKKHTEDALLKGTVHHINGKVFKIQQYARMERAISKEKLRQPENSQQKGSPKKTTSEVKNSQQSESSKKTSVVKAGDLKDDNFLVVDEWFDEDLEEDSAAEPGADTIQIPGLDTTSEDEPPPVQPPPALSDSKSKWDDTTDLTVVTDADETVDVDVLGDPDDAQFGSDVVMGDSDDAGGDIYVGDDMCFEDVDVIGEVDDLAASSSLGSTNQDVPQGTNATPQDSLFTQILSLKSTQPLPPGVQPPPPGMEPEIPASDDTTEEDPEISAFDNATEEDPEIILAEVPAPEPPQEIDLTAEEPSKISITLKDVPELDDDGSASAPSFTSTPAFKVPTFLPPARRKKGRTVRLGMPPKAMLTPMTLEKASSISQKVSGSRGVKGILEPGFSSRGANHTPDKSGITKYQLIGLPEKCKEGDVWKYFKAFGIGEIMSIFVCRPRQSGVKKSTIRFTGIGPQEHNILTLKMHLIEGKSVLCVLDDEEPSTAGVSKPSASASETQKGKEFSLKIPEILKSNPDWKGMNRGIEYVIAGYVCNVCQWFYKARKDISALNARMDHMKSPIHVKEKVRHKREEYGSEGVYCKVCTEFVRSKSGQKAVESAMDHCSLLKHHLNIKLYLLNNNLKEPKWLKNPLYIEGKKRKFTEGPASSSLASSPQASSSAKDQRGPPRSSTKDQLAPPGVADSSGLVIVDYDDSDDEEDIWTTAIS